MLEQDREETLDRTEQCPVDHDRPMPAVVLADVLHLETLWHLEVDLDRRDLPGSADRVTGLDGDLRAIEGPTAGIEHELEVHRDRSRAQGLGRLLPVLIGADRLLLGPRRQLEIELVEAEV